MCMFLLLNSPGWVSSQDLQTFARLNLPASQTDKSISLQVRNQSLTYVLEQIEKQSDFVFIYSNDEINTNKRISLNVSERNLESVLKDLLAPLQISYQLHGNKIVLTTKKTTIDTIERPQTYLEHRPLLASLEMSVIREAKVKVFAVSGRVVDDQNEGLPGVNVIVKGTSTGTITDPDGRYSLSAPDGNATLVFSFIGYTTVEEAINNRATINISMAPDLKTLDEVVVVGYGVQKKETITGSVATVKGAELVKSPALNVSNSLAGRMPGVVAVNRSGEPGADGSAIRIRGSNTLGSNEALVVIDGIPARAGGFERLNPADIESISVLKDASAAIYGARAANGVILITTKRGTTGKPQISYSFNQGFAQPTVIPRLANATQYAEMRNELEIFNLPVSEWNAANQAFRQDGSYTRPNGTTISAPYDPEDFQKFRDGSDPWFHPDTDWYKETLKPWSPQSQHNLQLNGGTENFRYLASLGYQNQDAFYRNSATGYKQYDMRVNLDANINKYIKTQLGVLARQENRFYPTVSAGAIFRMQMRGIPTSPAYWPNGKPGPDIENGQNPVVITTNQTGYDRNTRNYFQTNGQLDVIIPWVQGLKFSATAAVDKFIQQTKRWETPWYLYTFQGDFEADGTPKVVPGRRGPADPRLNLGNVDQLNILLGSLLTYERTFGSHSLNVLAGTNRETAEQQSFGAFRRYFISSAVDQMNAGGNAERNNSGGAWEQARLNYFGRVAYNFKSKYLAEFLWRYDGSYMFPANTRYGFFPGIMAGWQISEEPFWKNNVGIVNYLKLRGSWGQMGNDQIYYDANRSGVIEGNEPLQEYQYLSTNAFRSYIIGGQEVGTIFETRVPNPAITWEVANNSNIGLEGALMQGRINFEFDVFYNKRTNILWPKEGSIPQSTGMTLPPQNLGEVANRGWEFLIGYNGQSGDFRYNISVNGGYAKNKVLFWDEAPGAPEWQRTTGKPMYTYQAYIYDGVFRDQADIDATTLDYSAITNTLRPGDMKYKDYNGDGKITPDDMVRNDRTNIPIFNAGMNIGMQYRNFDLTILFQGAAGAQVYVSTAEMGSIGNYLLDIYQNRWTVDNPSSEHPRIADRSNQYFSSNNTYWLRSTDYIRLKNFEFGYTVPAVLGQRLGLSNVRVYVNGLNLLTFDKLKVYDPENANPTGQYYPQSRVINTGVNVTF